MKLTAQDWTPLRPSLIFLSIVAMISFALIYVSGQYTARAQQAWRSAQQNLAAAQAALTSAQQDQANLHTYLPAYRRLQQQQLIGVEPRLAWIEHLEKLGAQQYVTHFNYTIAPQKTLTPAIDTGNFELHGSDMTLEIELRHEAQLLSFFDQLRRQIPGWYQLETCQLTRNNLTGAGLSAKCSGTWLTLQSRHAP